MAAKSMRNKIFLKQKLFSKKSKNTKEAKFIYKPVKNEAYKNPLEMNIGL